MLKKAAIVLGVLVLAFLLGVGLVDLTKRFSGTSNPTSTNRLVKPEGSGGGALLSEAKPVIDGAPLEFKAKAICGSCFLSLGGPACHVAFQSKEQPKLVLPTPNAKLTELEKITGSCAVGTVEVTLKGTGWRYRDKNYVTISSFKHQRTREGSGKAKEGSNSEGSRTEGSGKN